jgi:hypothetical protein
MGASSSSAYWEGLHYPQSLKKIGCVYQRYSLNLDFIPEQKEFFIQDALDLLSQSNLFPEITLVLDIDFTLGQASEIQKISETEYLLNRSPISAEQVDYFIQKGKATWFHNQNILFFIRPYFAEFISFCDRNFKEVIIWTNGVQRHADEMFYLVERTIGKQWKRYGREGYGIKKKIVSNIGLDPYTTWMVDDDHNHYERETTNAGMKFFHTPEFSIEWFKDLSSKIPIWGKEIDCYDDWFLFLIWNWVYMKNQNMDMLYYNKKDNVFFYDLKDH